MNRTKSKKIATKNKKNKKLVRCYHNNVSTHFKGNGQFTFSVWYDIAFSWEHLILRTSDLKDNNLEACKCHKKKHFLIFTFPDSDWHKPMKYIHHQSVNGCTYTYTFVKDTFHVKYQSYYLLLWIIWYLSIIWLKIIYRKL